MQQNHFSGYVKLVDVKMPVPSGQISPKSRERLYDITCIGETELGSVWNDAHKSYEAQAGEVDLNFVNLSERQIGILVAPAEIFVAGASVISYNRDCYYPKNVLDIFDPQAEGELVDRSRMLDNILAGFPGNKTVAREALELLIPIQRRTTVIRLAPSNWTIKASARQLVGAMRNDLG